VVEDTTGVGIEAAEIGLRVSGTDSLVATTHSDKEGRFAFEAPRDSVEIRVRRLGFAAQRRTLDLTAVRDTVAVLVPLERMTPGGMWSGLRRQIEELQKPTPVTPCRPENSTARGIAETIRRLVTERDSAYLAGFGLSDLAGQPVEHVIDIERCRAAKAAIERTSNGAHTGVQVHLYRLGDRGWIAYEASWLEGHYSTLLVLDAELTRVRLGLLF
jgi:hypothetical protein